MKAYVSIITLLIFSSCSSLTKNKEREQGQRENQYSDDVEREFSLIETEQASASNYYRELRLKDWENYKKGSKKNSRYHKITPKNVEEKVVKEAPTFTPEQIQEFQIEIGQNLSYYCMKNRKSKRFSGEEDCIAYTKDKLNQCETKYSSQYGRKITRCLKKSLGI